MSWGLVLSGGAACGLANAGTLLELEREGLKPNYIAGSSMGAIIGAVYALHGSTTDLERLNSRLKMNNIAQWNNNPLSNGLHGGFFRQDLERHLADILGDARIGECAIPFVCVAGRVKEPIAWTHIIKKGFTDKVIENIEPITFPDDTKILDAIMASSAIPVLFSPVQIGEYTYIDLVHFGAIPARTLKQIYHPDVIIATNTTPLYGSLTRFLPASWNEFLERGYSELQQSMDACDLVITPTMVAAPFRFDKAKEFLEEGIRSTHEAMPEIKKLLQL